jgi:hypothetical protein
LLFLCKDYQAIKYVRLDPTGIIKDVLLHSIKDSISKGFPCMFGFTVYNSIHQSSTTRKIPYPYEGEKVVEGGHAIMAVGYDDKMSIKNEMCDKETKGALIIRNSWSVDGVKMDMGFCPLIMLLLVWPKIGGHLFSKDGWIQANLVNKAHVTKKPIIMQIDIFQSRIKSNGCRVLSSSNDSFRIMVLFILMEQVMTIY